MVAEHSVLPMNGDATSSLINQVQAARVDDRPLRIVAGDTKAWYGEATPGERLDMTAHRGVIAYDPCELVITARAGTPLCEIEAILAENQQAFAFEPPRYGTSSTIGGVVAAGLSGPSRPFAGAVRDHLLGVTVLDGRGRVLRFGGTVFKNVAGFDAFRLMCGALGTLGVLLEVSLRVAPKPETTNTLACDLDWPAAQKRLTQLFRGPHPIDGAMHDGARLYVRLSGARRAVETAEKAIGGEPADPAVWDDLRDGGLPLLRSPRLWRLSLPRTADPNLVCGMALFDWAGSQVWMASDDSAETVRFLARSAGGHATLVKGAGPDEAVFTSLPSPLMEIHRRLKSVFDPSRILNRGRLFREL